MSIVPPNLPDERTAQRLLDLLAQLEHTAKSPRAASPAAAAANNAELAELKSENAQLRRRQQQAREKLNALATKLEQMPEPETQGQAA